MSTTPEISDDVPPRNRGRPTKRWKLPKLKTQAVPMLDKDAKTAVSGMIHKLAALPPDDRQRAIDAVRAAAMPMTLNAVIDAMLATLKRTKIPATHAGLVETLVGFGACSVGAVRFSLLKGGSSVWQVTLVQILERIGPTLPAGSRVELFFLLDSVLARATDPAVCEAVVRALATLRLANDVVGSSSK